MDQIHANFEVIQKTFAILTYNSKRVLIIYIWPKLSEILICNMKNDKKSYMRNSFLITALNCWLTYSLNNGMFILFVFVGSFCLVIIFQSDTIFHTYWRAETDDKK